MGSTSYYTVERQGQLIDVRVPANFMDRLSEQGQQRFVLPRNPFAVKTVNPGSPADKGGLLPEDRIVQLNQKKVEFFPDFQQDLLANAGKPVKLVVERGGELKTLSITVDEEGHLGFFPKSLLRESVRHYSLAESVPVGTSKAFGVITNQITAFGKIFRGEASFRKSVGGPWEIAQQYGPTWDWGWFWTMTGMLSMVLAFMNLLPIPALDGGHVVFLLYEMIAGRKPSDKFLENAQRVGMMLLLSLMAFVLIINPLLKKFNI